MERRLYSALNILYYIHILTLSESLADVQPWLKRGVRFGRNTTVQLCKTLLDEISFRRSLAITYVPYCSRAYLLRLVPTCCRCALLCFVRRRVRGQRLTVCQYERNDDQQPWEINRRIGDIITDNTCTRVHRGELAPNLRLVINRTSIWYQ